VQAVSLEELQRIKLDTRSKKARVNRIIARRIRIEIGSKDYQEIESLHRKIEILSHFYFLKSRVDGFHEFVRVLESKVPKEYWDQTAYKYFVMMMQFDCAAEFAKDRINPTKAPDPFIRLHLEAVLLSGDAVAAAKFAEQVIKKSWENLDGPGKQLVFRILSQIGKPELLDETRFNEPNQQAIIENIRFMQKSIPSSLPIYCISLERDHRRLSATKQFMPNTSTLVHSQALLGKTLPRSVLEFGGIANSNRTDAEIGCSLSHLKAWESIADDCTDDGYALVIEDDSRFIFGPGNGLSDILHKASTLDAGLVFVNARSTHQIPPKENSLDFNLIPLDDIRTKYEPNTLRQGPGWGADGYLINGKTARYLSDVWLEVGLDGALDWQLYLMGQKDIDEIPMAPRYRGLMQSLKAARATGKDPYYYKGYVSELSIITTEDYGYSSISSGHL